MVGWVEAAGAAGAAARIMIEDGAYFKGAIEIDRKAEGAADLDRPAFARAAMAPTPKGTSSLS